MNFSRCYSGAFDPNIIYLPGSGVKDVVVEGNKDLKIRGEMKNGNIREDNRSMERKERIRYSGKQDIESLVDEIKGTNDSFDLSNYKVYEHNRNDGDYVVDFIEVIEGYETLSGYTAIISDGYLSALYDNTIKGNERKESKASAGMVLNQEELNRMIISTSDECLKNGAKRIEGQEYHYYYDSETGKKYLVVLSDCENVLGYAELRSAYYEIQ